MKYDIAAYVWPAYTGNDKRARIFWPECIGEWETVKNRMKQKPLWGYCNEADPKVMEKQIDIALKYGVNIFIYDWYWYDDRPFLENCLNDGFLKAKNNKNMKFYIMWANHDANYLWDIRNSYDKYCTIWQGKTNFQQFKKIVDRWINKYFIQKNYYKIDNKPLISIYDIQNLINSFNTIENINKVLKYLNDECRKKGFNGIHIQFIKDGNKNFILNGKEITFKDLVSMLHIDSITHYQYASFVKHPKEYKNIYSEVETEFEQLKNYPATYFPNITLGWNDQPRYLIDRTAIYNCTKDSVKKQMEFVKNYSDNNNEHKLIIVNSWNEWTESSYLEPDDVNGYDYLEAIKEVFVDSNKIKIH